MGGSTRTVDLSGEVARPVAAERSEIEQRYRRIIVRHYADMMAKKALKKASGRTLDGIVLRLRAIDGRVRAIADKAIRVRRDG